MLRYLIDKETGSLDLMINPNTGMTQQLKRRDGVASGSM